MKLKLNLNLIKCAFGFHKYGTPIKDEVFDNVTKICHYCGNSKVIIKKDGLRTYELDKREIINDIELDNLSHANQKIQELLKKLGYIRT